jgi:Right handed beta helix region
MMKPKTSIRVVLLACTLCIMGLAVQGQPLRTFVSGLGDDLNTCTRTAPCRNFQRGHDVVAEGGEVVALDSAGYGTLTITKSVTISGEGVHAALTAQGLNAVAVQINTADVVVRLRYLNIVGVNTSGFSSGINYEDGAALHVEHCTASGFNVAGLRMPMPGRLYISDSAFRNNEGDGIFLPIGAGTEDGPFGQITIERTLLEENTNGLMAFGGKTTIRQSRMTGNLRGLFAEHSGVEVTLDDCLISHNGTGIHGQDSVLVRVTNSTITNNISGLLGLGAQILSRQPASNTLEGNNTNGAFTGTYAAQ